MYSCYMQITVKCDIPTFAWLMAYIKADSSGQQPPETSLDNCLQLLLASHYLQVKGWDVLWPGV